MGKSTQKNCPFCAEPIQAAAIKCKHCNSWLDGRAQSTTAGGSRLRPIAVAPAGPDQRKILFEGSPAARAFAKHYVGFTLFGAGGAPVAYWVGAQLGGTMTVRIISAASALLIAGIWYLGVRMVRRSTVFRVTNTNIESESGILRKSIDVLELWRCRDVRYHQSLVDRILRISNIVVFTADVTTPKLTMRGMPASRKLFESVRDSIEIQRQSRNVLGMVE